VTSKRFIDSLVFEIVLSFFFLIHLFSQSWLWMCHCFCDRLMCFRVHSKENSRFFRDSEGGF
jgi:hypothetical protein